MILNTSESKIFDTLHGEIVGQLFQLTFICNCMQCSEGTWKDLIKPTNRPGAPLKPQLCLYVM